MSKGRRVIVRLDLYIACSAQAHRSHATAITYLVDDEVLAEEAEEQLIRLFTAKLHGACVRMAGEWHS